MKNLGNYLLAKDAHAIIAAFVCALLPLFYLPTGFIAVIIVALVTLQKGAKAGFWVLAWVALPAIASLVLHHLDPFEILLGRCVIVWALAVILRRFHSFGLVLEVSVLAGVLAILAVHIVMPNIEQFWITHLTSYLNEVAKTSEWKLSITLNELAKKVAPIATGLIGFLVFAGMIAELAIARFWQSVIVSPGSLAKEFLQIRIGQFAAGIAALLVIMALFKIPVMIDALPLILLPFFVVGLSLMHFFARLHKSLLGGVILVYIGLIFLPIFIVCALAAVGFIDSWTDFRKKVIKK